MAATQLLLAAYDSMAPLWVEISFMLFFILGFVFLRFDALRLPKHKKAEEPETPAFEPKLAKAIKVEATAGSPAALLKAWRAGRSRAPTPLELLKLVVQALAEAEPAAAAQEVIKHVLAHATALCNSQTAVAVLDVVARAGREKLMVELWDGFRAAGVSANYQMYEILLGGFATLGEEQKVHETMAEMRANRMRVTARGYSVIIKGFLKNCMVDAVLQSILDMKQHGFHVPPFAVTQFLRIACDAGRSVEAFDSVHLAVPLAPEGVASLLEDCSRRGDSELAVRVERASSEAGLPLLAGAYDALLKLHALKGDPRAVELWREMQSSGLRISEGLCVGLLARCADSKFLRLAEEIVAFSRARGSMSIALYSTLMKVFAYCGMYDRACDLYDQIREDGLEPDSMMYGCLMKFSVECGRTKLSQELSEKVPTLDIQNYMSLIRAAGRDRDVDRAFGILAKLQHSGVALDVAAYNCVLDVCVTSGRMDRARALTEEMQEKCSLDMITYNTLLKGYCNVKDLHGAKELLQEMQRAGHKPNDVSYNCLINAAVSTGSGDLSDAWDTIAMMEQNGVAVDHYTLSIMMKALKKVKHPRDVAKTLALLDRSGISICSDEILLNTILETCIRHHENRRLEGVIATYQKSSLRPSVHTYGSLIKAASTLRRLTQCWEFWKEMEELRGMTPNDIVLGCMLDALVCNGEIEDAVELFRKWKSHAPANMVIYSTIIKGFANSHQAERAMAMWREMRQEGVKMNTVVYNAVIDAQARVGAMEDVSELVEAMEPDGCRPDVITYSTIVKGYCVKGDLDRAFEVFRSMQRNGMAGECIIYNTILDGCTRNNRMDLADLVIADLEKNKIEPSNFTLGIMVKMWGRRRNLNKAFEAIEQLPRRFGFVANAQVKTCLMCACINNNSADKAFQVFQTLKDANLADIKAYGALVSGCARHGLVNEAIALVEESFGLPGGRAQGRHCPGVESAVIEQLLRQLASRGGLEQLGVPLLERLRAAKVPVSTRLLGSALGAAQRPGDKGRGDRGQGDRGR